MSEIHVWVPFKVETDPFSIELVGSLAAWWKIMGKHKREISPDARERLLSMKMSNKVEIPNPLFAAWGEGITLREWLEEKNPIAF
jgi:hypothetical protein